MNIIYPLPLGTFVNTITYLTGIEIAKLRTISKFMKNVIDENEATIYNSCMHYEFPGMFRRYYKICPFREDWKNLYVLTDQYAVGKRRAIEHRKTIERRHKFLEIEKVLMTIELILSIFSIGLNFAKIAAVGWSASSSLIKAFLRENPGSTVKDAIKFLGLNIATPSTIEPNFY
jgi:hypothetical protein